MQYVGIPKGQSFGLSVAADDVRLIRPEEVEKFFNKKTARLSSTSKNAVKGGGGELDFLYFF